jgi:uncharacterized cupredoxin-like copper-binding protein
MTTTMHDTASAEPPETRESEPDGASRPLTPTWDDLRAFEARLDQRAIRRDGWTIFIFGFAAAAVIFSIVAIGFAVRAIDDAKPSTRSAAVVAPATPAPPLASSPGPVTLSDFKVQPAATTVAAGKVTFQISNVGSVQHELLVFHSGLAPNAYPLKDGTIDEESSLITKVSDGDNIDPGASQSRTVDLTQPGTYLFVCNLPGHFKAGMYEVVTVK